MKTGIKLLGLTGVIMAALMTSSPGRAGEYPLVKEWKPSTGYAELKTANIVVSSANLESEGEVLAEILEELNINRGPDGFPVQLHISSLPQISNEEKNRAEGYVLDIRGDGIHISGETSAGVFYGIQTLAQMMDENGRIPCGKIIDWPDLAHRMIMVDPARQNENDEYYRRVIRFCSRWKINGVLCHLTDDQTSCLYHEDYEPLMHEHAWTRERIRNLVDYAAKYHVRLVPEIESFGHSRMFTRHPDFKEILHKAEKKSENAWVGTDIPGFTNVLCPASEKTYIYLEKMFDRAAEGFPYSWLHIGCDEVDMTECSRCQEAFPGISKSEWFRKHLVRCFELGAERGRTIALWGDMLLKHPEILDGLPRENAVIFDWYYAPDVSEESSQFFKEKGFDVIACPALVCAPHMNRPDVENLTNIRRFTEIARDNELAGVCTTVWVPQRYMSDVLWPGLALACSQPWSGSHFDEKAMYAIFMKDFFGSDKGEDFQRIWNDFIDVKWRRKDFYTACWINEKSLKDAVGKVEKDGEKIRDLRKELKKIREELDALDTSVGKNRNIWETMKYSVNIHDYTLEHLLAAPVIASDDNAAEEMIRDLNEKCEECIYMIEKDWDRNRYPNDPNKDGLYLDNQHLLHRFRRMRQFHKNMM